MVFFISPPFGNYLDFKKTTSIKGSFTLLPRGGLITRILLTLRYDFSREGWVNKIGLRNRGIDYAIEKYKDTDHIISVAILQHSDIIELVKKIPTNMNLELNVSCPNVEKNDIEFQHINSNLHYFLNKERKWCIVKVSPTVDMKLIDSYYKQGFRQFHCSNTVPLSTGEGGLSGKCIMNFNRTLIPEIKIRYPDTTIIAGGGISSIGDILKHYLMGADHFSFSTVFFNPIRGHYLYNHLDGIDEVIKKF